MGRLTLAVLVTAGALVAWNARSVRGDRSAITEQASFYDPTPPVEGVRMLPEWELRGALAVAVPGAQVLGSVRKTAFFAELIAVASRYVDVVVLTNRDEPHVRSRLQGLVAERAEDPGAALSRLSFQEGAIDSEWLRDYGPLFGRGRDGGLVLLDNMYRDVRAEAETERALRGLGLVKTTERPTWAGRASGGGDGGPYLSDYGSFWRRNDDAAPIHINEVLNNRGRRLCPLVRPPLQLSGGDVAFAADGLMFTSTRALEVNGGDERRFRRLVEEYFGVDDVTYLRPLPNGMWHIDMFFRFVRPGVVMLAELEQSVASDDVDLGPIAREATEALEWNRRRIEERMPDATVIRIPMPPILGMPRRAPSDGRTGLANLDAALDSSGAELRKSSTVIYRSFVNSAFVEGANGRSAVLIPSFSGCDALRPRVERAFRSAYPQADLHFVTADVLAEEFAGIHCVTLTLPTEERR